jgi:dihydrodipicolinate synthase/N-acetylneuraminate lyase
MHERLKGIFPPMATPFSRDGQIECSAIREQVEFLISAGVHGIVGGGSGGGGHTLDSAEFEKLMRTVSETINGRVPFVAGVIVNSTAQAIARARRLARHRLGPLGRDGGRLDQPSDGRARRRPIEGRLVCAVGTHGQME